ncbi:MAG: sulfurtransferase-like selenium metabolism protein YedF [Clostridium sp.]|uniref:sulfurtransferase-like selenium metabolism protein YedF n=1 Tax=Clostridium sp. TaxID=1506 RepID=UPI002FC99203
MRIVNCRGLECPKPVINTKKSIEEFKGEALNILVDNEVARENVSKFLNGQGVSHEIKENNGEFSIITDGIIIEATDNNSDEGGEVILVSKSVFGSGDDVLGEALMKSFMYALSESNMPSAILFVNGGVKLTTSGSDVLETLKSLEAAGVTILSCGTCLDFYNLKDELQVGGITNMYTIIEHLQSSRKVISL